VSTLEQAHFIAPCDVEAEPAYVAEVTGRIRGYALTVDIRSLGYRTDLMIRLLEGSRVDDQGDYLAIRSPRNPDYWWGNFLLLSAPPAAGKAREWLEIFAAEFPDAKHVALGIDVTEISGVEVGEFVGENLQLDRYSVLTATSIQQPPRPNNAATYRELTGDDDWRQAAELRAVLAEGEPGAEPSFLAARVAAERGLTEAAHGSWFGAFVDGQLVAQLGIITDGSGIARFQSVETHPGWRRKGIAGTLVWHAGRHGLDNLTAETLVMAADPDHDAIRVYRSVGFVDAETQVGFERQPG
jgi:GNAT superfamily N-acetyltransferase